MKNLLITVFLLTGILVTNEVFAQKSHSKTYTVYSVIGDVYLQKGQQKTRILPRKQIRETDVLLVPKGAAVNLLDESANSLCAVSTPGKMALNELLGQQKAAPKSLSKQYFAYLMKELFNRESRKMSHPDCYMQTTGTSYRSSNIDSLFISSVIQKVSGANGNFEENILRNDVFPTTDMNVTFSIISCNTGLPISDNVPNNESCYLSVKNETNNPLYVNVLDLGKDGSKYLLLPVDSASTCAHLLVPGQSQVDFKSEPFIFGEKSKDETFILFAVETPVDFSILMNPIKTDNKNRKPIPLGVFKKSVMVK